MKYVSSGASSRDAEKSFAYQQPIQNEYSVFREYRLVLHVNKRSQHPQRSHKRMQDPAAIVRGKHEGRW